MGLEQALFALKGLKAVEGFIEQRKAAKATKKANNRALHQAQIEAARAREDGESRVLQEQRDVKRLRSAQLAQFLSSGVTLDGSPLSVADETTSRSQENVDNIRKSASADAESILFQAEANKSPVQKADIFGTATAVLGAAKGIRDANKKGKKKK